MSRVEGGAPVRGSIGFAPARPGAGSSPMLPLGGDIRALLYALKMESREAQAEHAATGMVCVNEARSQALQKAMEAQEQARAAQQESGGWTDFVSVASKVATVAACVAAVASVVATSGASTPAVLALAGTVLSASSPLVAKATDSETAGKVALYGGMALSLGGAGASVLGAASGQAAAQGSWTTVKSIAVYATAGSRTVEGSARVAEGYGTAKQKVADAKGIEAQAQVTTERAHMKRLQSDLEQTVELLREVESSTRRAVQTILAIGDTIDQTRAAIVARVGRQA